MGKLCMLYNFAPAYREGIFKEIDRNWETQWFFGDNDTDINGLDLKLLSNVFVLENKRLHGHWYWQKGAVKLSGRNDFSTYFILGDPYCLSSWFLALRLRFFYPKKRLYFWTHGWYGKETTAVRIIKKAFFKLAHGIFLYGNYARELMIKEGFKPDKLHVIHNSLDYHHQIEIRNSLKRSEIFRAHFGNDNPVLIFIGRLTAVKHLDMLIEAAKKLETIGTPVNVVFVGDGSERNNLSKMVEQMGLTDSVWFYGACYDDTKNAELIYNADLCIAPGNVGLTAIHSMVFGTPVISHNDFKWQMPEFEAIKPGVTGNFFERNNFDSLVSAISNWLAQNKDRELVRENCFKEVDTSWTPDFQMRVLEQNLKVD